MNDKRQDRVRLAVQDWNEHDRVEEVYEAGLECLRDATHPYEEDPWLDPETEGVYALYRWDHAYMITLPDKHLDPDFCASYPGLEFLETYHGKCMREAVDYLRKREIEFYQPNDPKRTDQDDE